MAATKTTAKRKISTKKPATRASTAKRPLAAKSIAKKAAPKAAPLPKTAAKKTPAKATAQKAEKKTAATGKATSFKATPKATFKTAPKAAPKPVKPVARETAAAAAPKVADRKTSPAAPPRLAPAMTPAKKAFAKALGAWSEDETAVLARSGAEHEALRRSASHEAIESKKFEIRSAAADPVAPDPVETDPVATEFEARLSFPMTREIDDLYDETRLTVLVRDPEWVFAYWDIDSETRRRLGIPRGHHNRRMAIRWYDVTDVAHFDGGNAHRMMEIEISDAARSWYQKMPEANRSWLADLGIFDDQGHFVVICRSNLARMPRMRMAPSPEQGGPETVWMHVEHGAAAPSGKVPRKRILGRGEKGAMHAPGRPVHPSETVEFLGASERRVKKAEAPAKKKVVPEALPEEIFKGASERLMGGASEGLMSGASERLVNRKK